MRTIGFLQNMEIEKKEFTSTIVEKNFTHSCGIGETGCGKTTSYIYPNLDDRIKNDHGVLLYDYKGKEQAVVKALAKKHKKLDDVVEIGVPWGVNINILKYMSEAELKEMVIKLSGLSDKDMYWATSIANIVAGIFNIAKEYYKVLEAIPYGDKNYFKKELGHYIDTDLTFAYISKIVKDMQSIKSYVKDMRRLSREIERSFRNVVLRAKETISLEELQVKYAPLLQSIMAFDKKLLQDLEPLAVFEDQSAAKRSTTFDTLILAMSTTFATISAQKYLNHDEVDIIEALNSSKIIVINTKEFSDAALGGFTASFLTELSKRVIKKKKVGVSIFIDEAQRVVSKDMDLHEDILREAKVELFLSFQNHSLMIDSLGENAFYALYQNLSTKFHYRNNIPFKDIETDTLKTFEYVKEDDAEVYSAKKLFFKASALFKVQQEFFKLKNLYARYGLDEYEETHILLYESHLFYQNKILLEDKHGDFKIESLKDDTLSVQTAKQIEDICVENDTVLNRLDEYMDRHKKMMSLCEE